MNAPNHNFLKKPCERCEDGIYGETANASEWWVKCDSCDHLIFCYVPMEHQLRFHQDNVSYKLYAGGYGSAKTSTCGAEFLMLALSTPRGEGLVGAQTYRQLESTAKKQIKDMLPSELIYKVNNVDDYIVLTNGYIILFRSFDDEQKLRSLNLCHCWIEEANGTNFEIFTQLETRLRHHATDDHCIIMSTNPDNNWIKTEFLLKSARIYGAVDKYTRSLEEINTNMHTHVATTDMNTYLPSDYVERVSKNKPDHWINRYLRGSFVNAEGMVYPNFDSLIEENLTEKDIINNIQTKGWQVYAASDFGINDPTTLYLAAVDPVDGMCYIYSEYYKNKLSVGSHAATMRSRMAHVPVGLLQRLVGDPSGKKRNIGDMKSIFDHYAEHGIYYTEGDNRIDAGIMKVFGYMESKRLRILSSCVEMIREGRNYRYPEQKIDEKAVDKPIDKDNHAMDTLRYLIQELPDDPSQLKNEVYGQVIHTKTGQEHLPFELQTEEDQFSMSGDWYNDYY